MSTRRKLTGWQRALARMGHLSVAYLVPAIIETIALSELHGAGHPDAPASQFPEYLVFAPLVPVVVVINFFEAHSRLALASTGLFVVGFIASWVAYRKWLPWDI